MVVDTRTPLYTEALARPEPPHPRPPLNLLDSAVSATFSQVKFFADGWGDPGVIREVAARFEEGAVEAAPITVRWITLPHTRGGIQRMRGYFETPTSDLPLPPAARAAYFDLLLPEGASVRLKPPVMLHLAATGDQGLARRARFAAPLVRRGVGALILEQPYYGMRRPACQRGVCLRSVADQLMMSLTAVQEARSLLRWLREDRYEHLGVTGYSMGGYTAAYTASLEDEPVAAVPVATGASPAPIFTDSPMARYPDWRALGGRAGREALEALFHAFSLDHLPAPVSPELAILVAGQRDAIVAPAHVTRLAEHWGSRVRWLPGGHVVNFWRHREVIHEALLDVAGMLLARR